MCLFLFCYFYFNFESVMWIEILIIYRYFNFFFLLNIISSKKLQLKLIENVFIILSQ